jgi:uncharacterized membrane protein
LTLSLQRWRHCDRHYVLKLKVPAGHALASLVPPMLVLLSYALGFGYVGIYWNHHHVLSISHRVSGAAMWTNPHLLFWLSLFPFATAWLVGENHAVASPTAVYSAVLLMAAEAYRILQQAPVTADGSGSALRRAIGSD